MHTRSKNKNKKGARPVEGSVLAFSVALTPALALGARPSTSALTLALALALAPLPHRVLTSPSCSESCEEILVVLVGPRLRFMEMTNSRRARRATAPTRDIADIAPCSGTRGETRRKHGLAHRDALRDASPRFSVFVDIRLSTKIQTSGTQPWG